MNKYESIYIISPLADEEQVKATIEKFSSLISEHGEIEKVEEWGRKKLAYEVKDQKEGYYVMVTFSAESDFPEELERNFKITENILKYLIIRKED
ncbi:MAG: 30S ribosomal protein S6 [Clostridiaceae bacterium]|jgi:small subunit ribosomal protein S6|nr:30S ribosomal protein S6 [Clostridiaceae bacterium]